MDPFDPAKILLSVIQSRAHRSLSPAACKILIELLAAEQREVSISYRDLGSDCDLTRSTVHRALQELEQIGLISFSYDKKKKTTKIVFSDKEIQITVPPQGRSMGQFRDSSGTVDPEPMNGQTNCPGGQNYPQNGMDNDISRMSMSSSLDAISQASAAQLAKRLLVPLSEDEARAVAGWVYDQWTTGMDGKKQVLLVWKGHQDVPMEILKRSERDRERMVELLIPATIDFVPQSVPSHASQFRIRLGHHKWRQVLLKILDNPYFCGLNKERRQCSLQWIAEGDSTGPGGIAKKILNGDFDHLNPSPKNGNEQHEVVLNDNQ